MASGDLFRAFTVRFSFKKEQHVRMMQKFDDKKLNDGKVKNQVIMDALEMYYNALENCNDTKEDTLVKKEFLEQRLEQFKQECKKEILRELLRILLGGRMAGQPFMVYSPAGKPGTREDMKDEAADISEIPEVMDRIMDWSES